MGNGKGNAPYHSRTTDSLLQSFSFRRLAMLRTPAHLALTTTTHHSPLRLRRFVHGLANSRSSMTQATVYQSLTSFSKFAKPRGRFANLTPTQAQCGCATRLTAPSCSRPPMRWSDPPLLYLQTAA